jgi:hypothetical protein
MNANDVSEMLLVCDENVMKSTSNLRDSRYSPMSSTFLLQMV